MEAVKTTPYWLDTARIKKFPALARDIEVDVLVVGGGITGLTTSYLLGETGLKVALVERERLATRDTGHTTAHLTCVTDVRLRDLVRDFGREAAQTTWDAGAVAIDLIEALVRKEEIDCNFTRVPGYLHAPRNGGTRDERKTLREDASFAEEFGFDAAYLDSVPFMERPGVRFADQALIHTGKYLGALAEKTSAQIFEKTAVSKFDAEKHVARANGHRIKYDRVVLATNNPLVGEAGMIGSMFFQTKLTLYTSYVVSGKLPRGTAPIASFWDTNDPYSYLRIHPEAKWDYAIYGGHDHKTGQVRNTETCYRKVEKDFRELFPEGRIDHRWSGQVIETTDGLPFIGENEEKQFIATGYNGNGITFGTVAAMMARDWITGARNPWRDLFSPSRKKIKGNVLNYLRENKDYPYYLIKGLLARPEAGSVRALKPGEGKILKLNGRKVAAYRDRDGKVIKRSAVCTHMGCIVRWNQAEKTWDCPCHGSRFRPTGEVIAGPAEAPLSAL
jgi:glycine/D-amino acid oxidase-like deaminating enzyme/nitrite reductase/ring-hydroxylating ferredoxin subunit